MNDLLRRYVLEIIKESELKTDEKVDDDDDKVNEFSGAGAIAGFTAPLGWSGKDLESTNVKERKKRKKSSWK